MGQQGLAAWRPRGLARLLTGIPLSLRKPVLGVFLKPLWQRQDTKELDSSLPLREAAAASPAPCPSAPPLCSSPPLGRLLLGLRL